MSNLAFYASPIDFNKNVKLENKLDEIKKKKINADLLKELGKPSENDVREIHSNILESDLKEENDNTLADFYSNELKKDENLSKKINEIKSKQNIYNESRTSKDGNYLISNNLNANKINYQSPNQYTQSPNQELLNKLNHIIGLFEEQKEIKTKQKNEEVVLYCFMGIFVIYVLDSFVYIGKYSR